MGALAVPQPCTCCGNLAAVRDPFFYEWIGRTWWIYRCGDCTHQFVFPSVTAQEQALIYGDAYFSETGDWAAGHFTDYVGSERIVRDEARRIIAMLPPTRGALLDIGCAGGFFLDEARKAGYTVAGLEYNARMADHARSLGVSVIDGRIEDVPASAFAHEFDTVVMLDVLEHIPQPRDVMTRIGAWSKDHSTLLIRGPLVSGGPFSAGRVKESVRRFVGIQKQLPGYPLDANMWNRRSLQQLIGQQGFVAQRWIDATASFANVLATR